MPNHSHAAQQDSITFRALRVLFHPKDDAAFAALVVIYRHFQYRQITARKDVMEMAQVARRSMTDASASAALNTAYKNGDIRIRASIGALLYRPNKMAEIRWRHRLQAIAIVAANLKPKQ